MAMGARCSNKEVMPYKGAKSYTPQAHGLLRQRMCELAVCRQKNAETIETMDAS
jgi:hypothetical protein